MTYQKNNNFPQDSNEKESFIEKNETLFSPTKDSNSLILNSTEQFPLYALSKNLSKHRFTKTLALSSNESISAESLNSSIDKNPLQNKGQRKYYTSYSKLSEIKLLTIGIASPLRILQWAEKTLPNGKIYGEVLNANTLHHKTFKPQKGGLFCERIFGPLKDFECACGKVDKSVKKLQNEAKNLMKNAQLKDQSNEQQNDSSLDPKTSENTKAILTRKYCPECDVEYTWSVIRRYQLGYIKLSSPVTHIWFLKGTPSYLSLLLDIKKRHLQFVTYCSETLTIEKSYLPFYSNKDSYLGNLLKTPSSSLSSAFSLPDSEKEMKNNNNLTSFKALGKDLNKKTPQAKKGWYLNQFYKQELFSPEEIQKLGMKDNTLKYYEIFENRLFKNDLPLMINSKSLTNKENQTGNALPVKRISFILSTLFLSIHYRTFLASHQENFNHTGKDRKDSVDLSKSVLPNSQKLLNKLPLDLYILCSLERQLHKSSIHQSIQKTWETLYKRAFIKSLKNSENVLKEFLSLNKSKRGKHLQQIVQNLDKPNLISLGTTEIFNYLQTRKKPFSNLKDQNSAENSIYSNTNLDHILSIHQNVLKDVKGKYHRHVLKLLENLRYPILSLDYTRLFLQKNSVYQLENQIVFDMTQYLLKNTKSIEKILSELFLNSLLLDQFVHLYEHESFNESLRESLNESFSQTSKHKDFTKDVKNLNWNSNGHSPVQQSIIPQDNRDLDSKSLFILNTLKNYLKQNILPDQRNENGNGKENAKFKSFQKVLDHLVKDSKALSFKNSLNPFDLSVENAVKIQPSNNEITAKFQDKITEDFTHSSQKIPSLLRIPFYDNRADLHKRKLPQLSKHSNRYGVDPNYALSHSSLMKQDSTNSSQNSSSFEGKIQMYNNIYTLSHRERWDIDKDWYIFSLFSYGITHYSDYPIFTYKKRLSCLIFSQDYNYNRYYWQKDEITQSTVGHSALNLSPSNFIYSNSFYSGAGIVQQLLNEFDFNEIQKLDKQNRLLLYLFNKSILNLKKFVQIFVYDKVARVRLKELCKTRDLLIRRTKLVRKIYRKNTNPASMILTVIPVLPPDLRPIVKMGNQIAASDLNRLYQRVIYRNDRLKKFLKDPATSQSYEMKYAQRLLQEAVDNLMQNGKSGLNSEKDARGRALKSLSDILKGKQGRFRQFLLGKRVDYSGRSVIVVGPRLKLHECGLPIEMAKELYLPFLLKSILNKNYAKTVVGAKTLIKNNPSLATELLREIMQVTPVLLNRAPTLHRLGIQAFVPKLIEGRAILLHPLVCSAFNADFDGDQMAVHVPITVEARAEAWKMMLSRNNLLSPATGDPLAIPSQDMVLGCYYLTTFSNHSKTLRGSGMYFNTLSDVMKLFEQNLIDLHALIWLKWTQIIENGNDQETPLEIRVSPFGKWQEITSNYQKYYDSQHNLINLYMCTTPGRIFFNLILQNTMAGTKY